MVDFEMMHRNTQDFMALWRSYKPIIARVHGPAVAGGSDIALCCDMVVMAEEGDVLITLDPNPLAFALDIIALDGSLEGLEDEAMRIAPDALDVAAAERHRDVACSVG